MKNNSEKHTPVIAVCGKGGVGKTVISALISKALIENGTNPILLVDADAAGGLVSVIGERSAVTLADVRDKILSQAGSMKQQAKVELAGQIDYLLHEALVEKENYSLLAMGHSSKKGCYCPVNNLLREAIEMIGDRYAAVVIDAEAGIEQINRQVTKDVTNIIAVVDGSKRSLETLAVIREMIDDEMIHAVVNRFSEDQREYLPTEIKFSGFVPEDEVLKKYDRAGRNLWDLTTENKSYIAVKELLQGMQLGI